MSERNEPKGYLSFQVNGPGQVAVEYVEGTPQKYYQYDIDLIERDVRNEVGLYENVKDAVVKVKVRCTQDQKKTFDHVALSERLKGAAFVMPTVFEVEKSDAPRKGEGLRRDVRWQDALKTWLEKQNYQPEMKEAALDKSAELFRDSEEMK